MEPMTPDQIKKLLQKYYDIPQMIDEELASIRHCQEERGKFSLSSPILSGLPTGKGSTSDQTADGQCAFDTIQSACQNRRYYPAWLCLQSDRWCCLFRSVTQRE